MNPLRAVMIQMAAGPEPEENLSRVAKWVAACSPADLILLPEMFACRCGPDRMRILAEPLDGPMLRSIGELARANRTWMLAGSIPEKNAGGLPYNTSALFGRDGRLVAAYRKTHLFEVRLKDGARVREAEWYTPGSSPTLAELDGWSAGLSICFDLRFPALYGGYAALGAHLLLVPSDFTRETGRAHWHALLRARAIENQCFVAAPNQCGTHPETGVVSFGHSLAVGPWGETLAEGNERDEGPIPFVLDPARLDDVRSRLPMPRP